MREFIRKGIIGIVCFLSIWCLLAVAANGVAYADPNYPYPGPNVADQYAFNGTPFSVVSSGTFNGTLYKDAGHGLPTNYPTSYTQKFQVPAGTVTWARLYVGVWGGTPPLSGMLTYTFNGAPLGTAALGQGETSGIANMVEECGDGVWWTALDVTGNVVANSENTVVLATTDPDDTGFDGRTYGAVLVAAVAQPGGPKVSYAVSEGNICMHYDTSDQNGNDVPEYDEYSTSLNFPAGSLQPAQVVSADLATVYLTGHPLTGDSLYLNNNLLSANADDGSGTSLDTNNGSHNTWSNAYFGVHDWSVTGLTAQNNTVEFQRGSQTYISPVLAVLTTISSSADTLSGLAVDQGALNPSFDPGALNYTDSVDNSVTTIDVTPTADEPHASVTVNGAAVASGVPDSVPLEVGPNTIDVSVTAADGVTEQDYIITVTRAASSDDTLSSMLVNGTTVSGFSLTTLNYTDSVANSIASIDVTPTASNANATIAIAVNGGTPAAVASGTAYPVSLDVGDNTIDMLVTAQDGITQQTYTIDVNRAGDDTLSSLTLSSGTLSTPFDPGILTYTAGVPYTVASDTVTAVASSVYAQVYLNGAPGGSRTLPLIVGPNAVAIMVYAQDGTSQTYSLTITRGASLSSDATLDNLALSSGTLSPAFSQDVTSYTAFVDSSVTNITVTSAATDSTATVTVNGAAVAGGSAAQISLTAGTVTIVTVVVTAQNGITQQTYTVNVSRPQEEPVAPGSGAPVAVTQGTPVQIDFPASDTTPQIGVATTSSNSITTATLPLVQASVQTMLAGSNATIAVTIPSGTVVSAPSSSSWNGVIDMAQIQQPDSVTIPNAACVSAVVEIGFGSTPLTLSHAVRIFLPGMGNKAVGYVRGSSFAMITTALPGDSQVVGDALPYNGDGFITVGNDLVIWTKHFTNFVVYTAYGAGDDSLSNLAISSGALTPEFSPGVTSYTASVDNSVTSITVTPTADNSNTTVSVNGTTVAGGQTSGAISLSVGANTVSVVVYAQDQTTTETYIIVVTRNNSSSGGGSSPTSGITVTSISPTSGPYSAILAGDQPLMVTITGAGFTGATAVNFGTQAVTSTSSLDSDYFTIISDTSITVVPPGVDAGGVTVDVTVTGPNGTSAKSSSDQFTYLAPPGYEGLNPGSSPLATATHGTDTGGGLLFTRGDSRYYSQLQVGSTYTVHLPVTQIPSGGTVTLARLYGYYCWSESEKPAQCGITLNGSSATLLNSYSDTKGCDPYNYPFGTISFDATSIVTGNGTYTAVLTNEGTATICPFGIGLVVVYHDPNGSPFEYWLNEGADIIWPGDGVTVAEATTRSTFSGSIDTSTVAGAELITVVTSGDKGLNTLTFNGGSWSGVYKDPSQLAVGDTDVTSDLQSGANTMSIDSGGSGTMGAGTGQSSFSEADTMCPSNAFLVVTYNSPNSVSSGSISPGTGGTASLGSEITVTIPPGALNGVTDVNVTIQKVSRPPAVPSGLSLLGSVFDLTVGGASSYKFAVPVTLTFTIDTSSLTAGETPSIYYYDQDSSQWVELGGTVSGNAISVDVDQCAEFAVLVQETVAPTLAPPVPVQTALLQAPFSDVPASYWASSVIAEVYSLGCISGYPDGTFRPNKSITRAEFVTMLVKAFKLPVATSIFFDDTVRHWARDYIGTALHAGIATGYRAISFGPDDPITREQMAVMIAKAAKLKASVAESYFNDRGDSSAWARSALAAVAQFGMMMGYPDGSFHPRQQATRAEAVAAIVNALKVVQQ